MFVASFQDKAFDDILLYLKDKNQGQPVKYVDFTNHVCGLYGSEGYILMKQLKEKDLIDYDETVTSFPVRITIIGLDYITRTSFVKEAKKPYDKEQILLNQTVSVGTNYGQINAGHQSSFTNLDQNFSTNTPQTTPNIIKPNSLLDKKENGLIRFVKNNWTVTIIGGILVSLLCAYLAHKFGWK